MTMSTALRWAIFLGAVPSWFGFMTLPLPSTIPTPLASSSNNGRPTTSGSFQPLWASTPKQPFNDAPMSDATMATALCVVPPDSAWDTIQRARHVARDRSYFSFPPALRLFHPFCPRSQLSDAAMNVARVVEQYQITPFTVLLNQWVVIPHWEALEADWEAMRQLPNQQDEKETVAKTNPLVDELIEREERVGLQRRIKRLVRRLRKQGEEVNENQLELLEPPIEGSGGNDHNDDPMSDSPQALLEKQKQMYEEFNGPCVVCLEPDDTSREKLLHLREILRRELFAAYEKYSPSSSVSEMDRLPRSVMEAEDSTYRPLVPIGAFPTVTSAIEMARKLKGLWDPLEFNVTDLHVISQGSTDIIQESADPDYGYSNLKKTSWMSQDEEQHLSVTQYGCDAMIRLVGEELEMDHEWNEELANMVMKNGMAGGYEASRQGKIANGAAAPFPTSADFDDDDGSLDKWLDDDDEWDEGTVVVLGRTHFFTGEMRVYVGMPAASAIDAKDKALGEGISGAARRRGSTHRQGDVWQSGEFGRRDSDFTPRSSREKRRN